MAEKLRRCRSLADRTGRAFAVVLFEAPDRGGIVMLTRLLRQRCRLTDELGLAPRRLCAAEGLTHHRWCLLVLLPETAEEGALCFCEDVCRRFPHEGRPTTRIRVYQPTQVDGVQDDEDDEQPPSGLRSRSATHGASDASCSLADTATVTVQVAKSGRPGSGPIVRAPATILATTSVVGHSRSVMEREAASSLSAETRDATSVCCIDSSAFTQPLPWWKRALDVIVSGGGLIALSPLILLLIVIIRIDSRGAGLFWQWRAGLGGRPFRMAKFRTMVADAERRQIELRAASEQDGPAFKLRRDPRVTRVGLFLRATSLDEIPQLWNVLRGDMTLVGPRPLPVQESDSCLQWQRARLDVTPGLTCIWQVHGRSRVSFEDWMRMDLRYVRKHLSRGAAIHDLVLLVKTAPAIFLKRGF